MKHLFLIIALLCIVLPLLTADADAPPGRYTVSNGTVLDNRTGLTWQQAVDPEGMGRDAAIGACESLPLAGGGWRLPLVSELLSIVDRTRVNPAIDPVAFPSTPAEPFWSASANVGYGSGGWPVDFATGRSIGMNESESTPFRVRCVR